MQLADTAWRAVDVSTIQHCWRKAGILPELQYSVPTPSVPITSILNPSQDAVVKAEKNVEIALDNLVATGVLQSINQMSLEALLNPQEELLTIEQTTDEEIFEAVMDAKKACKESPHDEGDNDIKDDAPSDICPTRNEALQAALVVKKYIPELNDPFTCKLEAIIGTFGWQTRLVETQSLKPTVMTDYFSCK
jgi:hypothetical protein